MTQTQTQTQTKSITRSMSAREDVTALLRARNPILLILTREEARVERCVAEAAAAAGYIARSWDCAQGVRDIANRPESIGGTDAQETLAAIDERSRTSNERCVWIMRDLTAWLAGPLGATPLRMLKNLSRSLPGIARDSAQAIVVIAQSAEATSELSSIATVIEWPLPDRAEIKAILDAAIAALPESLREKAMSNGQYDAAIDAAVGLTGEEAAACFARSLVQLKRIDPALVASEKKRIITRERVLEWYDPIPGGLDAVGGLDHLRKWLSSRAAAYTPEARTYGLPAPKGCLLLGVPGCGKSWVAKALATAWNVPLLKLDLGALKSKYVGESEGNLRRALRVIEAIGRCVVWVDEIEKAMQGATSGSADGGVSSDALGTVLSWMQERQGEAFVIATANDIEGLPPELLRKGRFDDVWWVDLPTRRERASIASVALRSRPNASVDLDAIADACATFTGAEITALVPDALFAAFADGQREVTTQDLLNAAQTVTPLAKTAKEKIERLRAWAAGRARPASPPDPTEQSSARAAVAARVLDI